MEDQNGRKVNSGKSERKSNGDQIKMGPSTSAVAAATVMADPHPVKERARDLGEKCDDNVCEPDAQVETYEQYKGYASCVLSDFLYERCVVGKQCSDDPHHANHAEDDEYYAADDSGNDNPHQQELESQSPGIATSTGFPVKVKRPKIPRVQTAQHIVHRVSQIDLHTKILHLNLCRVEKIWPLRQTQRMAGSWHSAARLICRPDSLLPCFRFGRHEDDGPLFIAYKEVVTMEVTQMERPMNVQLHETTSNIYPEAKLSRRVFVYFYNHYAQMVNAFMEQNLDSTFYVRLLNVPATCIFPYQQDHPGGFADDVCAYVLCMGGASRVRSINNGQNGGRLSFDHPSMKILLLAKPNDPTKPSNECVIDHCGRFTSKYKHLQAALHTWKVAHDAFLDPKVDTQHPMPEIEPFEPIPPEQTLHDLQDTLLVVKEGPNIQEGPRGELTCSEPLAKRFKAAKLITFEKLVRPAKVICVLLSLILIYIPF
jgi:hypothetical protein